MAKSSTTSSAHTAGPWFISNSRNPDVYKGQLHLMIVDEKSFTAIADIETKKQAKANARLIAAAPDYHAAAIKAMQDWQEIGRVSPEAIEKLRKAIAKTQGK